MATIKVAKAFNLLLAPNEKPARFEVGEHEVEQHIANHWYVQEHLEGGAQAEAEDAAPEGFDPATATRDELTAYLRTSLDAHLAELSEDELREFAAFQLRREVVASDDAEDGDDEAAPPTGDTLLGGAGNDTLAGSGSEAGPTGNDTLGGGEGNDTISGAGSEAGSAEQVNDTLTGEAGNDSLGPTGGDDSLSGGQGDDTVAGSAGGDTLANPDKAKDSIEGGAGDDTLARNASPKTRKA